MHPRIRGTAVALTLISSLLGTVARAEFITIEDFETLTPGPIGGQAGWTAPGTGSTVAADPVQTDAQVLSVLTESTHLFRELVVAQSASRMLFFRFRIENQASLSFGLSDVVHPDRFDHFEIELSVTNSPTTLRINNGGTYDALLPLQLGTWYNCWVWVDNGADSTQVWLHPRAGENATSADRLAFGDESAFAFRNGTGGDLATFYTKTGGGNGVDGPILLDDIHLEDTDTLNLTNPADAPTATVDPTTWGSIKAGSQAGPDK